jgi:CrcB protein
MLAWLAVGLGGALGSMARHGVNRLVNEQWPSLRFPLATAIVNILGCCIIGVLAGLLTSERLPMRFMWREFVFIGILGGFTTFSAFGLETITLLRTGSTNHAFANAAIQTICGLGGVYAGLVLSERIATNIR